MNASTGLLEELASRCKKNPGNIAFPESDDPRILQVASLMLHEGTAKTVALFMPKDAGLALARQAGVPLHEVQDKIRWEAPGVDAKANLARAAEMVSLGQLDASLAGNVATTADVIRAGIAGVGLAQGVRTVSGAFIMNRSDPLGGRTVYLFADCGVVIAPTAKQLVDIGSESVRTWSMLFPDVKPVIAFLSYSTKGSAQHETAQKIAEAAQQFKERHPDVESDGELQFDACVDPAIGRRKAPGSPAAGRVNCFVFPDLGAGNIAYKIAQRLGGFEAYGPILQGLSKPFSDLSRGATVNDIVASAYINLLRRGTTN